MEGQFDSGANPGQYQGLTPTVRTLPPKVDKRTLPPKYETYTYPSPTNHLSRASQHPRQGKTVRTSAL